MIASLWCAKGDENEQLKLDMSETKNCNIFKKKQGSFTFSAIHSHILFTNTPSSSKQA